ncbi:SET domain protein [Kalmanozyma brasiliensis GHG001]|uniref:SET domain-containing protein n=1 Tax=Kalmanozyma brasiliensis (strain GHG001) TaxID=1365824 RepID=V5GPB5_KALBG|nr:SET domain protein [Kalmanozyma brasiliensis GHG001]EST07812.1 SET domain protein [Kalmanozyma brasiliensis GHG001]
MEDLLKALRKIGLALPDHEQLLQLSDPDSEVQDNLARHLSLTPAKDDLVADEKDATDAADASSTAEDDEELALDPLVDADLFKGAVQALLENYNKAIDKERDFLRKEREALSAPKKLKPVPLKALLARQAAEIKKRQEEVYVAGHDPDTGRKRRRLYLPRQTFDGVGSYASEKPLDQLKRIDADELEAPKRFDGRYVLCKVASSLNLYVGCTFIGVLPSGNAIPISIAHFTSNLHVGGKELDAHLPVGTVLAIREPFVSINHFAKGGPCQGGKSVPGIRVDTPTDVHILDRLSQADANILDATTWKIDVAQDHAEHFDDVASLLKDSPAACNTKGCRWLQDGPLARLVASSSAESAERHIRDLDSSRKSELGRRTRSLIQSLLGENRPGAAYRELCAARLLKLPLSTSPDSSIAEDLELEGQVLYRKCDFARSRLAFESALSAYPSSQRTAAQDRILDTLTAVRAAQKASALGPTHENVWAYYFDSQSYATPRFDVQDWFGPVEIANIPGAGRGLVLTRDVDEGELLLCCKAAASSYAADSGCRGVHLLRYTVESGVTSTTTQVLAATRSVHAMVDRNELTLPIMGLTAGPGVEHSRWVGEEYPSPPKREYTDAQASADEIELLIQACSSLSTSSLQQRWRQTVLDGSVRSSIDTSYVDGVLRFNAFGPAANPGGKSSFTQDSELTRSTMVHPLPAILNHACLPNVSSVFFGDIVTTRALHPLKKGTEIMHQYVKGEQPWLIRRSQLSKHGFKCGCGICVMDERDGEDKVRERGKVVGGSLSMLQERSRIVLKSSEKTEKEMEDHRDLAESLQELVDKVQATYHVERPILRPDLMKIYQLMALHQSEYDLDAAARTELQALQSIGCTVSQGGERVLNDLPSLHFDGGITSMLTLAKFMLKQEKKDEARRWVEQAFYTHQCTIGGGLDIFLDRWLDAFPDLPYREWLPRC